MELRIISPEKTQTFDISWLEAHTPAGSFVIKHGHAPMVLALQSGKQLLFQLSSGKQESFTVQSGMLEVNRTKVIVLVR